MELRNPSRLGKVTRIVLWIWLGFDLALSASALFTIKVLGGLGGGIAPMDRLQLSDDIGGVVGIGYTITFIASAIAVLRWTYVTNTNAHVLSDWPIVSPRGAVGWYFVPIAGLYKPFQAMRECWQASIDPADPASVPVPPVMRWWWGAWIIQSLLGNITFRLSMSAKTPDELIFSNWMTFASTPFDIVAAITLTTLVARLSAAQRGRVPDGNGVPGPA